MQNLVGEEGQDNRRAAAQALPLTPGASGFPKGKKWEWRDDVLTNRSTGRSFWTGGGICAKQAVRDDDFKCFEFKEVTRPNKTWVTDITYIRTWQGWMYLAVVMDLFSRKIVGWSTSSTMDRSLVLDAVMIAIRRRRPSDTLIQSDQGTQYGSDAWRRFCASNKLIPSMSRKGNRWDNALAESFFSSLKKERIKKHIYRNRDIATAEISEYFESFYNSSRRHSYLGGISPEAFKVAFKRHKNGVH